MSSSYKLEAETDLINEGAFQLADEVVGMESIFDEVWKCLQEEEDDDDEDEEEDEEDEDGEEEDVGIIGVYGMGGVGKTTLLKQIHKKLLHMHNGFDVVIWVVVSRDLQLDKIQEQIGEKIGLFDDNWEKKNLEEKASDIFNILTKKKFVLLMDDVWERVDLIKVGVPLSNTENSSKIVFTTPSLEICSLMDADRQFKVKCLADEEAWKLFQTLVGDETLQGHPEVHGLARDVSKECCGLPLALVFIGGAMAGLKTLEEWRYVLQALKRSASSNSGSVDELIKIVCYNLKRSYDNLQNDMFKSCLLYCCLFSRNGEISKRDLIDYWIGEGLLDDGLGVENRGYYIIDVLLSACLLEEHEEDDRYVKMHKLIYGMCLWIASEIEKEKGNFFICTDVGLTEPAEIEKWKDVTRIVINNSVWNLPDAPNCPHLQTLFLNMNRLKKISDDFFQFMPCLKVLNLSKNILRQELPSEISKLDSLQHLDLSYTSIKSLPNQLGALRKLKCLNLEHTPCLHTIPRWLISKFSVLHVLRLWECGFLNNQSAKDSVVCNDAQLLIEELLCLENLSMLSITLRNSHALQKLLSSNRLQSCTQSLWLRLLHHPKSIIISLTNLKHLNTLWISECECLEELEVDFVGEAQALQESPCSFNFLHEVIIENCPNLRDLTWLIVAPNLKRLQISDCSCIEEIINVGKLSECLEFMGNLIPFSKLKFLTLENLPNLRSIYCFVEPFTDLNKIFTRLHELCIINCPKLSERLPDHLPSLHKLVIKQCPELLVPTSLDSKFSAMYRSKMSNSYSVPQGSPESDYNVLLSDSLNFDEWNKKELSSLFFKSVQNLASSLLFKSVQNLVYQANQVIKSGGTGNKHERPSNSDSDIGKDRKHIKERVAFRKKSEVEILEYGYKWRKYGKKVVKNSPILRDYYKCSVKGCPVRKRVKRNRDDPSYVVTTYEGIHNHETISPLLSFSNSGFPMSSNLEIDGRKKMAYTQVADLNNSPPLQSSTIRSQGSRVLTRRRQRSGTSSKRTDRAEEFLLAELAAATNDFALENKIGVGSFGVVYRGTLRDGREVAIKRGEMGQKGEKLQETESAFVSEMAFLSRLHHKHLVRLVGFCEEEDEMLLVYEYMKNGALYDHLHDKNNVEKSSSVLNSWKMRIKIAMDASRGIEYLHNYAVPPIIHRDIKSSNILLDAYWTARVSDLGLSLVGPESEFGNITTRVAGTPGYLDPEYYRLNVLTTKSDVFGLGVVLLELLTGKRAIFRDGKNEGFPLHIMDFAVPAIMAGELDKVLDPRVGPPTLNEVEAVELVAYTAMQCVKSEGKERPTIADIVANLERALALCVDEESHGSISSDTIYSD